MKIHLFPALLITVSLLSYSQAAITLTTTTNIAPDGGAVHDPYDPASDTSGEGPMLTASSIDLVQGLTELGGGVSTTGDDNRELSAGLDVTTDGSLATVYGENTSAGDAVDHAGYATIGNGDLITYSLGGLFDISQVDIYAGWNDSGRDNFSFNLLVSNDGSTYTEIANYEGTEDDTGAITVPVTNLHSIVDDNAAEIATDVRFIQLEVLEADNGYAGLAEFDVFGTQLNVPGDANNDGFVDIDDFFVISDNFFSVPSTLGTDGDINSDGIVDQKDFRMWRNINEAGSSALSAAVPEPTSITLIGSCVALGLGAMRRRS